jgi:hypothetical protein
MRSGYRLGMLGWLLMPALAFGQTSQQPSTPPSADAQPTASQPASPQPANPKPTKPSAVASAADASRQARESAPPIKVIRNHDLNDGTNPPEAAPSEPNPNDAAAQAVQDKASEDKTTQDEERKVRQFYAQGLTFKNQVKVQKGKIVDIQNRITSLKNQFAAWSVGFAQDSEAQACWTSTYYTPYYKDWCDRVRNLKAQYEASQLQLTQEKVKLEQMQEKIRRAGYGNAVYDPD